ncbi:cobalt ECF transporter T component CbiQ [Heliobacterium chlorum]|uniref:Cobalt ECF transporter T component CbiQ n=1 Tax=Heliobacterium chlorum TaxID=2698 RepID=A0ABR7T3L4_HELCL|nr:cobalt ECF transporter T component CbiQ [Heliobacterium chlorum]MBC9784598.1 cobalt ECF transporter T component CbiQ [Heliobacterium chlorum]
MIFTIDQWAWSNGLRDTSPRRKGLAALVGLILSLSFPLPAVSVTVIILTALLLTVKARIPLRTFLKLMTVPAAFLLTGTVTIAFSLSPVDAVWQTSIYSYVIGISAQGLQEASTLLLRSLGATASLYFFVLTTPMVDAIELFNDLRTPRVLTDLMLLTYRFTFVLMETTQAMITAQEARLGYTTTANSFRSFGILAANLFIRSLLRSRDLYTALAARGYEDELRVLPRKRG